MTKKKIRDRRKQYNKEKKNRILSGNTNRFHECVRTFSSNDKKKNWNPRQLYEGKTEQESAELLAEYFNNISNEHEPLDMQNIPVSFDVQSPVITPEYVEKIVKEGKNNQGSTEIYSLMY